MVSKDVFNKILKEYEFLRDSYHLKLKNRKQEIYNLIPRIKEIDEKISQLSISISKEILKNPTNSQKLSEQLRQKSIDLKIEKSELLASNNYPTDYLTLEYSCKNCKDTGFVDNRKCKCLEQKLINHAYKNSNLSSLLEFQNFDNFKFEYYSDLVDEKRGISPNQNMKEVVNNCFDFINNFDDANANLIFTGTTGVGKTFLSSCIAKELLDKGKTVFYQSAFKIFDVLEEYKFSKDKSAFDKSKINILFDVDLLIVDDLGTEFINSYTSSEFFNILNSRLLNKKSTIISTNLSLNELFDIYSARVVSRIIGHYKELKFFGEDLRKKIV